MWARGTQSNLPFAVRPPARNDHTKNPFLNHIDFSAVNEMVKYCDIFCSKLEENDYDVVASAINPVAAIRRNEVMAKAEAYRQLRPLYEQFNQLAGRDISPPNPIDYNFESQRELQVFFQIGFKLKEELFAELGTEVVNNDSDWNALRKLGCEDIRDLGHIGMKTEVDLAGRIRTGYLDLINCGWEDFRGHYLAQPSRFWHLNMKTGAQIVAESNFTLTPQELFDMAKNSEGRYGNPMLPSQMTQVGYFGYINTDNPTYQNFFYDSWKFPVLEAWWEDWDIMKYRQIQRTQDNQTESFSPVNFNYKNDGKPYMDMDSNNMPVEKRIKVSESHLHYYRQCKWVVGTSVVYDNGPVRYCPRNPYDIRFALCPIMLYRVTGAPPTQRLKAIAKVAQNAWYKLQNEIAMTVPHGYHVDIKKMNNITSADGKKIKREHILELYNETGRLMWSSAGSIDEQGISNTQQPPLMPIANVDIAAMQRWWDTINNCSARMQQESGFNEFTNAGTPNPETPATSAKAAMLGTETALAQYIDALSKINEEIAIRSVGYLQQLVRDNKYEGYVSSIGGSILTPVSIDDSISDFTFGIKVRARPTFAQRQELKETIRQSYASVASPQEGSPYLADLLYIEQLIDGGTNLKLVALIANYLQQKNMANMQQQQAAGAKAQTDGNMASAQQQSALKIQEEEQLTEMRKSENAAKTDDAIRLASANSQLKGENQAQSIAQRGEQKKELLEIEKSIAG